MRARKALLVLVALILVMGTALVGCGNNNDNSANGGNNAGNGANTANNADNGGDKAEITKGGTFRMNLHSEPPTLDPAQTQDNVSSTVLTGLFEGLTRIDNGEVKPAMAEKWEVSEDGLTYTFHIRPDAKWSNGDAVTANDFEFSWKRVLDPATQPAPVYAYQLYYIKNAQEFNEKKVTDFSQVGIKAVDAATLQVTLKAPTPYFLSLVSFYTYYPVHQSAKDNAAWAAEANTIIANGPFIMSDWQHNSTITLTPNPNYYAKDEINLDSVVFSMVSDSNTELSMYDTDELDYTGHPTGEIPTDLIPNLKSEKGDEFRVKGIASTYYYVFNTTAEPFDNVKIRKAFAMSIDRTRIVEKVTLGGQIPAFGFVPPGIAGQNDEYRNEVKDDYFTENNEEAKKLLAEGMAEKGYTKLPEITLIHNQNDNHKKIATAIADMWSKSLGVTVKVESQEWGVFLKNRTNLNYQVARAGWGADYNDPMTYIDLWTSTSGNNDSGWKSTEYDDLVKKAYSTDKQDVRIPAMAEAEKMLIDNMIIMPIYYYSSVSMLKPKFKNITLDYKGDIDYTRGYVAE